MNLNAIRTRIKALEATIIAPPELRVFTLHLEGDESTHHAQIDDFKSEHGVTDNDCMVIIQYK